MKHLMFLKIQNMMDTKKVLLLWFYKCFDKKSDTKGSGFDIKQNVQLVKKLHRPIIRKFQNEKYVYRLETIFGV